MRITVKDLVDIIDILQKELSKFDYVNIDEKGEYFWDINASELYDPYKDPTNFELKKLSEEWEALRRSNSEEKKSIMNNLRRLAYILISIQENGDIICFDLE